jgi:hypothetical protein
MRLPLLLLWSACRHQPPTPPVEPSPADRLREHLQQAEEGHARDRSLELVRAASWALRLGDGEQADRLLSGVVPRLQSVQADGRFAATVGAEDRKEWKGEPYEKMMAYLYVGWLRLDRGEAGNALAMSKSAILADTGARFTRYQGDFIPAWLLQALALEALDDRRGAERAAQRASDALASRKVVRQLSKAIAAVEPKSEDPLVATGREVLLSALPAGAAEHPSDPARALEAAADWAQELRKAALGRDGPPELEHLARRRLRACGPEIARIAELTAASVASGAQAAGGGQPDPWLPLVQDPPSLIILGQTGLSPRKTTSGSYDQLLVLKPSEPSAPLSIRVGGEPTEPLRLDDLSYQATTRGGRGVDAFLQGKAVFRDSSLAVGYGLMAAADAANSSGDATVSTVLYVASAVVFVAGALTNPQADTRAWEELPDRLWLHAADPPPGPVEVIVNGRPTTVVIPPSGTRYLLATGWGDHRLVGGNPLE